MSFKPYSKIIIRDANLVNEGKQQFVDVLIQDGRIEKIAPSISHVVNAKTIHANGNWLIPGMIDDQVHFRDPGSPHKGSIASESMAAVMGGITSYMDMPNTNPPTLSLDALMQKKQIAAQYSMANYAFHFGVSSQNLEIVEQLNPKLISGVKVFMGHLRGICWLMTHKCLNVYLPMSRPFF